VINESLNSNNVNDSLQAMIVVIENTVLKSSYAASPGANSETEYKYVMRKMIPDASGTKLFNKNSGGQDQRTYDLNLQNIKNLSELRVVAFVQNISTREIYQSAIFTPTILTAIPNDAATSKEFFPFPNPAKNSISINNLDESGTLKLLNGQGKIVWSHQLNATDISVEIDVRNISRGIYVLMYSGESTNRFAKVVLD